MIRTLLFFFCFSSLVLWNPAVATGFQIIENGESLQAFESALEKANLEPYRLRNKNRTVGFKDGPQFILTSLVRLASDDSSILIEKYVIQESLKQVSNSHFLHGQHVQYWLKKLDFRWPTLFG